MTARQKFLRIIYPVYSAYKRLFTKSGRVLYNKNRINPPQSFYNLTIQLNNGTQLRFDQLKGKKVLIVNTASDCGYTAQYKDLETLYEKDRDRLIIIGFPANDFRQQEKGTDEEIAQFCKTNFGVTFPVATKGSVVKGSEQQKVFQWLTDQTKNGWNWRGPSWNFCKYLVSERGVLMNYFGAAISPLGDEIKKALAH